MEIKIDFERGTDPYIFKDALYFTIEQFDALTSEEIEAIKDERYNNWYEMVTNPPVTSETPVDTGPSQSITVLGETYELLTTIPNSGDKLIELNNNWYKRV